VRFLVDASSDARLVPHLRGLGHDVTRVGWDYPRSLTDAEILEIAHREARIVITDDRDFGELVFRRRQPSSGVLSFRLETTKLAVLLERLDDVLTHYSDRLHRFLVVSRDDVRERSV
jgi:predicted nuclease of predicted toxin-antitoxin system